MESDQQILKLCDTDNVGIALGDLNPAAHTRAMEPVARGYKIALRRERADAVCFTTRSSVFGAKPVPSIKLATNPVMARHMAEDIDIDCGAMLNGSVALAEAGRAIFQLVFDVASGRESANEANGLKDFEFVPWQLGAIL